MIFSLVTIGYHVAESYYLLGMSNLHRAGIQMSNVDRYGLIYNGAINVGSWAITGIGAEWAAGPKKSVLLSPDMCTVLGATTSQLVVLIMNPMLAFYFFHAAIISFKMTKRSL